MDESDDDELMRPRSPRRSKSPRRTAELNIKEFELPSVESLNKLSKVQVLDFALQHTTPELLLNCLKKNVNDDSNAIQALEQINKSLEKKSSDVDDLIASVEGINLNNDEDETLEVIAVKPATKPAAKPAAVKCKGVKKDGNPCSNNALPGSKYCKIHAKQKTPEVGAVQSVVDAVKPAAKPAAVKCKGVKNDGNPCSNNALPGSKYCKIHEKQKTPPQSVVKDQGSPKVEVREKSSSIEKLVVLYKEKVGEKKKLTTALIGEKDEDIKLIYKEELASLKTAIADIESELKKHGKNPNLLAFGSAKLNLRFGKNKFASTTNNMKMPPGPARSSGMYGIQMAPPQYVDSNQMVWPVNMPLGRYYEPNLRNVTRDYPGPTGGRSPTLPPQSAAKMESQFRAAQSRISFGRKRRSKRRSAKRKRPAKGRTRRQFHSIDAPRRSIRRSRITVFNGRPVGGFASRSRRLSKKRKN